MAALRWGIAGAGKISFDFCLALKTLQEDHHCIVAVGARSLERAQTFAATLNINQAYGNYDDLFQDTSIDIVYIGTINTSHKALSINAMRNGKHVLCEKPATMNSMELEEVLNVAKEEGKLFMEALWTRCFPLYLDIQEVLKSGAIGDVTAVQVSFGISALKSSERVMRADIGGSVLMDVGIYGLNFIDIIFRGEEPTHLSAVGINAESGVDLTSSITFLFDGKRIAQLLVSGNADLLNEGIIVGTKGRIIVKAPFWCPTAMIVNEEEKSYPLPQTSFPTNFMNSAGLRFEAEHMRKLLNEHKTESSIMSHDTSRRIMKYLDKIRTQLENN